MPRQSGGIRNWAALRTQATGTEHQIIEITEDPVSGAVSPFARAGLGPWLRRPLLDTWTVPVLLLRRSEPQARLQRPPRRCR
jgi:hypothetical protein